MDVIRSLSATMDKAGISSKLHRIAEHYLLGFAGGLVERPSF
jgi:hypothetical protein